MLVSWIVSLGREGAGVLADRPEGRVKTPKGSSSVAAPRDEPISMPAPVCYFKIGSQNRTLPLPESGKTDQASRHDHESAR
jgi:hypothetical protein